MRMDVVGQSAGDGNLLYDAADAAGGQSCSAQIEQQRWIRLLFRREKRLPFGEIFANRFRRRLSERNNALLLSFAAHEYGFVRPVDIVQIDADEFGIAQATTVEQFEDDRIALGKCG